jgi:predicted nucleotidyltransferase
MRLNPLQRSALRQEFARELGADCPVLLFGSRLDDAARGGDVDLFVQSPRPLERKVWLAARLAARAERILDGRSVDVLLVDPNTQLQPVHDVALRTGIPL